MRRLTAILVLAGMSVVAVWITTAKYVDTARATVESRNGEIAFTQGGERIFIIDPEGTDEREIQLPYPGFIATWSPDATRILVTVIRPDGFARPLTVDPDGSNPTLL